MTRQAILSLTAAISVFVTAPSAAFAEYTQAIQELFQSDTVYPQEKGEVQLTLLPTYAKGRETRSLLSPMIFEYGITDRLQFEANWLGFARHDFRDPTLTDQSGIGDLEIGFRYSWMEIAQSYFHAAFGVDVNLPIGDERKGLGEGHFAVTPAVVIAADMDKTKGTQFMVNFGAEIQEGAVSTKDAEWFLNFAVLVPIRHWTLTAEWNLKQEERYLTPGIIWQPRKSLEIGVGLPIGLTEGSDDYRVVLMFTWEFDTD